MLLYNRLLDGVHFRLCLAERDSRLQASDYLQEV